MLTASSIRYGGMLVDAAECNYTSFKHLGLLCPICKRSVFLVGKKLRPATIRKNKDGSVSDVKESNVCSYFAHHSDVDRDTINDCELRSSQITQTHRLAAETTSRNQRQKIMQAHMWKIINSSLIVNDANSNIINFISVWKTQYKSIFKIRKINLDIFVDIVIEYILSAPSDLFNEILLLQIEQIKNGLRPKFFAVEKGERIPEDLLEEKSKEFFQMMQNNVDSLVDSIDAKMHMKIINEALSFLLQKRQRSMLVKLILGAMHASVIRTVTDALKEDTEGSFSNYYKTVIRNIIESDTEEEIRNIMMVTIDKLLVLLVHVDWAYQFEALESRELVYSYQGKGFGK